jgi:hypothetical protein
MNEVIIAPVSVEVSGEKKAERQLSVVRNATSSAAIGACLGITGKVGAEIRTQAVQDNLVKVARQAAWPTCNYRPMGEMLAIRTGTPKTITNRASFESQADIYADMVATVKLSKSGGYTTNKKTGVQSPNAALKLAMDLHNTCVAVIKLAARIGEQNKAEAEAKKAEPTALTTQ